MSTYQELETLFRTARDPYAGKPLANNTQLEEYPDYGYGDARACYGIRLHSTVILRFTPRGTVILNMGGWNTVTTEARMNDYLPAGYRVSSNRGKVELSRNRQRNHETGQWDKISDFFEGMELKIKSGKLVNKPPKSERKARYSTATVRGWHFVNENYRTANGGLIVFRGETLSVKGDPILCAHGLHASPRIDQALHYHRGPILCRVELSGKRANDTDKMVTQKRQCLR